METLILQINDHFHVRLLQVDQNLLISHGPLRLVLNDLQMISLLHCYIHRKFGRYNNTYQIDGHQQVRVVIVPPGELSNRAGNYIINIAKRKDIMIPHNKLWWIHIFFLSILNLSALFYWHSYLEETVCDLYVFIYLH